MTVGNLADIFYLLLMVASGDCGLPAQQNWQLPDERTRLGKCEACYSPVLFSSNRFGFA